MTLALYRPGTSRLHRLPAGVKLGGLVVAAVALALVHAAAPLAAAAGAALALLVTTGAPAEDLRRQIRGVLVLALLVLLANVVLTDWRDGVVYALRLSALVLLAAAVTLTTRTDDMLDLLDRLLGRFGPRGARLSDRIGLAVALVVRFVPELLAHAGALREAAAARGLRPTAARLLVPLLIRTLRTADAVTDALEARGWPRNP